MEAVLGQLKITADAKSKRGSSHGGGSREGTRLHEDTTTKDSPHKAVIAPTGCETKPAGTDVGGTKKEAVAWQTQMFAILETQRESLRLQKLHFAFSSACHVFDSIQTVHPEATRGNTATHLAREAISAFIKHEKFYMDRCMVSCYIPIISGNNHRGDDVYHVYDFDENPAAFEAAIKAQEAMEMRYFCQKFAQRLGDLIGTKLLVEFDPDTKRWCLQCDV